MSINIFLSYAKPYTKKQKQFLEKLKKILVKHDLNPMTLGETDYSLQAPLVGIKELMLKVNGLLCIAFRRTWIDKGIVKYNSDLNQKQIPLSDRWTTSSFCQIEPSMAFQLDLPILIFKEKNVLEEGILEKGIVGTYMPEFNLDDLNLEYFRREEFNQLLEQWENLVILKSKQRTNNNISDDLIKQLYYTNNLSNKLKEEFNDINDCDMKKFLEDCDQHILSKCCIHLIKLNKNINLINYCCEHIDDSQLLYNIIKETYKDSKFNHHIFILLTNNINNNVYLFYSINIAIEIKQDNIIITLFNKIDNNQYLYRSLQSIYLYNTTLFNQLYANGNCFTNETYKKKMKEFVNQKS